MKIETIEKTLVEIREREDFLVQIQKKDILSVSYFSSGHHSSANIEIFYLNQTELDFLKSSCITKIKLLKQSIECLTE